MSKVKIVLEYIIDNEDWSDQEYEDNQDVERKLEVTEEMLRGFILQNVELQPGDFIDQIIIHKK